MSLVELSAEDYHADLVADTPTLSASIIHRLCSQSPAHAKAAHPKLSPELVRKDSKEFDVGTVAHTLLLNKGAEVEVVEADSWRTNAAKEARDIARAHGRVPLLEHEYQQVNTMIDYVYEGLERLNVHPVPFTDGKPEQTITWNEGGVACRARLDWLRADHSAIDDFKTAANANPEKWSRTMFDHGCDIQAAFYMRGVAQVFEANPSFRFLVVEKTPPHAVALFELAPDALALANRKIDWALEVWADCLKRDHWPAYPQRTCWVNLAPWAETLWLDTEARYAI